MSYKKRKSPYKFETHLNSLGDTVVTLCKGKNKVWLFNIGRDGDIVPVLVTSGYIRNKAIVERLNDIEDRLDIFK